MRRSEIVITIAAGLLLAGGGTAVGGVIASGPTDNVGIIHGCWTNAAINGTHAFVMRDAATTCPKGTTAIQWNKTGPQGPAGPAGTNGANGRDGSTILSGTGPPATTIGVNGDYYMDTAAHQMYGPKANDTWPAGVSLIGPTGPTGAAGVGSVVYVSQTFNNTTEGAGIFFQDPYGRMAENTANLLCPVDHPLALSISTSFTGDPASQTGSAVASYTRSVAAVSEQSSEAGNPFQVTVTLSCLGG